MSPTVGERSAPDIAPVRCVVAAREMWLFGSAYPALCAPNLIDLSRTRIDVLSIHGGGICRCISQPSVGSLLRDNTDTDVGNEGI